MWWWTFWFLEIELVNQKIWKLSKFFQTDCASLRSSFLPWLLTLTSSSSSISTIWWWKWALLVLFCISLANSKIKHVFHMLTICMTYFVNFFANFSTRMLVLFLFLFFTLGFIRIIYILSLLTFYHSYYKYFSQFVIYFFIFIVSFLTYIWKFDVGNFFWFLQLLPSLDRCYSS